MKEDKAGEVRAVFDRFLAARNEEWLATYSAAANWA
jgi:hypothetical protein